MGNQCLSVDCQSRLSLVLKTPALLVYAVICIITIYITKRIIVGRIRLSKQILIARVETAHEQKIYESKLNFFTNVAHEFFTPLTLIYTPVQYLLEKKGLVWIELQGNI